VTDGIAIRELVAKSLPELTIHLAGATGTSNFAVLNSVNVQGTVSVCEALADLVPGSTLVLASSSAIYGESGTEPVTEDANPRPLTWYGVSKAAAELAVQLYQQRGSLRVITARLFNLVGPGQPESLAFSAFARQIACAERGLVPPLLRVGDLSSIRDFVDVRDAARAMLLLSDGECGSVYNVASGRAVTMEEGLGILIRNSELPDRLRVEVSLPGSASGRIQVGSPFRMREKFGWRAEFSLDRSLRDTLDYWRSRTDSACSPSTEIAE
jgi:nucleoside-diphosphate-sugar epimerase